MRRRKFDGGAFAKRRIVDGAVRFFGRTFRVVDQPNHPEYDGRLNGRRAVFYSYDPSAKLDKFVFLHSFCDGGPEANVINGYIVWDRWRDVAAASPQSALSEPLP